MHASRQWHLSIYIVIATISDADSGIGGGADDLQLWTFMSVLYNYWQTLRSNDSRLVPIIAKTLQPAGLAPQKLGQKTHQISFFWRQGNLSF